MQTFSKITLALFACIGFAGCSYRANNALEQLNAETALESQVQSSDLPASTGNVDQDFAEIEASLDSMNADVDFPSVSEAELTAQ